MNHKLTTLFLAIILTNSIALAGDASKGKAKSVTCVACHSADGNSVVANFPKIAGQGEAYIFKQLKDFKKGARQDGTMAGIVSGLSIKDMSNLAAYFSSQTVAQGVAKKTANITLGEKLYRGGDKAKGITACSACHGVTGKGIPSAGFPALASQHAAYTSKQLKDFRQVAINIQTEGNTAQRNNDDRKIMIAVTKNMTNKDINALAQYIAGLH
jgi:cytochrome c553